MIHRYVVALLIRRTFVTILYLLREGGDLIENRLEPGSYFRSLEEFTPLRICDIRGVRCRRFDAYPGVVAVIREER